MLRLLGPNEIRALAKELDLRPTKKLGQNFVTDPNTIRKIVASAKLEPSDSVVEIGPGLGSLTLGLLEKVDQLTVIEFDSKLAGRLEQTIEEFAPGKKCLVIEADAMRIQELPTKPTALVANLPYNISVPVILHFLASFPSIRGGAVLVQSEVADRLVAKPGSKIYGAPSAKLAWYALASSAGKVSRNIFWPVPNVDSSLVYFKRRDQEHPEIRELVFAIIDAAFAQRRKTLRQALATWAGGAIEAERILLSAGISPKARGEDLAIEDYVKIAKSL